MTNLVAAIEKKAPGLAHLADKFVVMKKQLNGLVSMVKVYKLWVKKGNDEQFIKDVGETRQFLLADPPAALTLPPCMECDLLTVNFCVGIIQVLKVGGPGIVDEMKRRFAFVSLDKLEPLCASDEARNFQLTSVQQ
eukprot:9449041-Pyramimonas_sp.AAC.1